jgi:Fe-S cluster assembly ATPase SufC
LALLELKNLHVALEDGTEIVKGVDLGISPGEVHAVMGPNGSGKSTLAYALMGTPAYEITEGQILFDGEDLTEAGADERAQKGLFLAFQYPARDPGRDRHELPPERDQRDPEGSERRRRRPRCRQGVPHRPPRGDGSA